MGWIDYGARMYMPEIGRWNRIDDQFERYIDVSPYVYCVNNPLFYVDPDGESLLGWAIRLFLTYKKYDKAEEVYRIVDQYDFDPQTRNGILFLWGALIQAHQMNVVDVAWGMLKEGNVFSGFLKAYEIYNIINDESLSSEERDRKLLSLIPVLGMIMSLEDAYDNFTSDDIDYFLAGKDAVMILQEGIGAAEGLRFKYKKSGQRPPSKGRADNPDLLQGGNRLPDSKIQGPPNKRGNAPIGDDGHPVELHHRNQTPDGPIDEMTRTNHRGKGNYKKNHPNTGQEPTKIDRNEFNKLKRKHWEKEWDLGRFKGL